VVAAVLAWLSSHNVDATYLSVLIDPGRVLNLIATTLSGVATFLSVAFLVVLIASFMLFEAADSSTGPAVRCRSKSASIWRGSPRSCRSGSG